MSNSEPTCKHCGGPIAIRNPRGDCDHLYWPDQLSDEAKRANGFRLVMVPKWVTDEEDARREHDLNGPDRW